MRSAAGRRSEKASVSFADVEAAGEGAARIDRRWFAPVTVTVLFLVFTWLLTRGPGEAGRQCSASTKGLLEKGGERGWVFVADAVHFEETGDKLPAFACGTDKRRGDARLAQVKLLRMVPRLALFLRTINASFWIDKDNLQSATQHAVADGLGRFHPLDHDLQLGMFAEDVHRVYRALRYHVDTPIDMLNATLGITAIEPLAAARPAKAMNYTYAWGLRKAIVLINRNMTSDQGRSHTGVALKVVDPLTGASIVVTSYARDTATGDVLAMPLQPAAPPLSISRANLLPLAPCTVYDIEYQCPAEPLQYLNDLAGVSWVARPKSSRVKWVLVAILFVTFAWYTVKRS